MSTILPGDRFTLPSGRAVQVTTASRSGGLVCCRYLVNGAPSRKATDQVSFTEKYLEKHAQRLAAALPVGEGA